MDVRPVRDSVVLEGKELEFKVIKLDQKRNNVVVSRRSAMESEGGAEREALMTNFQEGQETKGCCQKSNRLRRFCGFRRC